MKTYFFSIPFIFLFSILSMNVLSAQELPVAAGYELVDSVVYRPAAAVDSTLVGVDVFAKVNVEQSPIVEESVRTHIIANKERGLTGYRVRIFFDNRQVSRTESEETLKRFESLYHDVVAYRTYANPYFKVTVGDFRTRSEAVKLLERIKGAFPSAFVVKENIEFPVVDKDNAYVTDTVRVLRPVVSL